MILEILLFGLFGAATAGYAYSQVATRRIERDHPMIGRVVDVDGDPVHVLEAGDPARQSILLLHGASGNARDQMYGLGEILADKFHVIAPDRPGHGYSGRPDWPDIASPQGQARLIAKLVPKLTDAPVIIVGHSWGGALGCALSLHDSSRLKGLVLLAPVTHPWPGGITWYYRLASLPVIGPLFCWIFVLPAGEAVLRRSVESVFLPESPPHRYAKRIGAKLTLRPEHFRANGQDMAQLKQSVSAQSSHYEKITLPTVIITGDADKSVLPEIHSYPLSQQIEGARLVVLEGVGHMLHHTALEEIAGEIEALADAIDQP